MKHKGARGLLVLLSLCLLMVGVVVFGEQIAGSMKLTQVLVSGKVSAFGRAKMRMAFICFCPLFGKKEKP